MCMTTANHPALSPAAILAPVGTPTAADEVNHRVANHLQLISALISAEARTVSDPALLAVLERTRQRIAAVGGIHRHLYANSSSGEVDLGEYLDVLGMDLSLSCGNHRRILIDAETLPVASATASSIGIQSTELVTNACKHAYAPGEPGDILVSLRRTGARRYRFTVEDHGRGLPGRSAGTGLGSRLIDAMVAQLGAVSAWEQARPGTRFRMDLRL